MVGQDPIAFAALAGHDLPSPGTADSRHFRSPHPPTILPPGRIHALLSPARAPRNPRRSMTTSHNAPRISGSNTDDPPTAIWRSGSKRSNGCVPPPRLRAKRISAPPRRCGNRQASRRARPSEPVPPCFARRLCPSGTAPSPCSNHAVRTAARRGFSHGQCRSVGSGRIIGPHPPGRRRSRDSRNRDNAAGKRRLPSGLRTRWRSRLACPLHRPLRPADHRLRNAETHRAGTFTESAGGVPPYAGNLDVGMPATGRSGSGIVAATRSDDTEALFNRRAAGDGAGALARKPGRSAGRSTGGLATCFPSILRPTPVILRNRHVTATDAARPANPAVPWPCLMTKP